MEHWLVRHQQEGLSLYHQDEGLVEIKTKEYKYKKGKTMMVREIILNSSSDFNCYPCFNKNQRIV